MRLLPRIVLSVVLAMSTMAWVTSTSPAQAATGDLDCLASFQINFTTPLTATNTSSSVDIIAVVTTCVSPNGTQRDLVSAQIHATGSVTSVAGVPCNLLLTLTATATFTWNTGQMSVVAATLNTDPMSGPIGISAMFTSGRLSGDSVGVLPLLAIPNLSCLAGDGLRSVSVPLAFARFS